MAVVTFDLPTLEELTGTEQRLPRRLVASVTDGDGTGYETRGQMIGDVDALRVEVDQWEESQEKLSQQTVGVPAGYTPLPAVVAESSFFYLDIICTAGKWQIVRIDDYGCRSVSQSTLGSGAADTLAAIRELAGDKRYSIRAGNNYIAVARWLESKDARPLIEQAAGDRPTADKLDRAVAQEEFNEICSRIFED